MGGTAERKSIVIGLVCAAVALVIIGFSYVSQRGPRRGDVPSPATGSGTSAVTASSTGNQTTTPKPEEKTASTAAGESKSGGTDAAGRVGEAAKKLRDQIDYGTTKPVDANTNPQVRSVAEALRDKNHPERLSPLITPKPFDAKAYKENPKLYLEVVEPGRCFQSAQPGEGVPLLRPLSPQFQEVAQGQSITLRVKVAPKAPCSFTSFDLGKFQNELSAITVEADEQGVAETKFFGTPGTINEVNIQAASPMSSGQARFIVNVTK